MQGFNYYQWVATQGFHPLPVAIYIGFPSCKSYCLSLPCKMLNRSLHAVISIAVGGRGLCILGLDCWTGASIHGAPTRPGH